MAGPEQALRQWQRSMETAQATWRFWLQWHEMLAASAVTMSLRLTAIQNDLNRGAQPEAAETGRMWFEKMTAVNQGNTALYHWQERTARQAGRPLYLPWVTTEAAAMRWAFNAHQWMNLWLRGASGVLAPYHSKSTANARRLSRKSSRMH